MHARFAAPQTAPFSAVFTLAALVLLAACAGAPRPNGAAPGAAAPEAIVASSAAATPGAVAADPAPAAKLAAEPAALDPAHFTCCGSAERVPAPVARAAIDLSPAFSAVLSTGPFRQGYITARPAAWAFLTGRAHPLDILLTAGKNWIPGQFVTGRFTHSAVYLGTEAQLRALGIWDAPQVVPHHDEIRAGKVIVEGVSGGAKLNDPRHIFDTDAALLVRPSLAGRADRRKAALRLFDRIGVPFDYAFDVSTCDRLACTEMLAQSMPQVGFVVRVIYGHPMLVPDDIAAQAIRRDNLAVVGYARGTRAG